jgi:putative ABC transport system permease protein
MTLGPDALRPRPRARAGNGGMAARRAMFRWAWRLFRREWRSQVLLLVLLGLTVAGAIFGGSAAYNISPLPNTHFGSATQLLTFAASDSRALAADLAVARKDLGPIEVIGHRYLPIPGSVQTMEVRTQAPAGRYGAAMLALRAGRYPTGAHEAALTQDLSTTLGAGIGDRLTLGGQQRRIVGVVEDPLDLSEQFALVSPAGAGPLQSVSVLSAAPPAAFAAVRTGTSPLAFETLGGGQRALATTLALVATTVLLLLIALVASAGFAVIAQRRLRQLGMLAAVGATQAHLRLVMVASGAVIGGVAAAAGAAVGVVLWAVLSPLLETAAGHRLSPFGLPWAFVAAVVVLAFVSAVAAAWWPSRLVTRVPVVEALSSRPPQPRPAHRSALLGVGFVAAGVACLVLADQQKPPLLIGGMVAMALGILYVSPLAIRLLAALARRLPIGMRLSLRDLGRHQARSAAALAAISLALGIAFATTVAASAAQHPAGSGNLSSHQLLVRIGDLGNPVVPVHSSQQLHALAAQIGRMTALLNAPRVVALDMPFDPAVKPVPPGPDNGSGGQPVAELDVPTGPSSGSGRQSGTFRAYPLYVATPALLRALGVDPATVSPASDVVSPVAGALTIFPEARALSHVRHLSGSTYSSAPSSALTLSGLRRRHWDRIAAGWLIESGRPLTSAQIAQARAIAASAGLTIETRDYQRSLGAIRLGAACAGMLLALGILAMTVGLIRTEAVRDLRVLIAAGAHTRIRRMLNAATAGSLALLGVAVGLVVAYLGLAAAYRSDLATLGHVPLTYLAAIIVCVPLGAFLAGWLFAGREPPAIARNPIE